MSTTPPSLHDLLHMALPAAILFPSLPTNHGGFRKIMVAAEVDGSNKTERMMRGKN